MIMLQRISLKKGQPMKIEPNNIYCGDCYELIKSMEDNSVDRLCKYLIRMV